MYQCPVCDMTKGKGKATVKSKSPVPSQAASRSGHPGPSASSLSSAIKFKIFCLLLPDPSRYLFSVSIHNDQTVNDLKKAIKKEKVNDLNDIDADKLILYKVVIAATVFTHAALSLLLLVAQTTDCCHRCCEGTEEPEIGWK